MLRLQLAVIAGWATLGLGCGLLTLSPVELTIADAGPLVDATLEAAERDDPADGLAPEAIDPNCGPSSPCPANEPAPGASCEDSAMECEYRASAGCSRLFTCQLGHFVSSTAPWESSNITSCHAATDSWLCGPAQGSTQACECILAVDAAQWIGSIDASACQCPATLPVIGTRCTPAEERCSYSFGCGEPTIFCSPCGAWSFRPGTLQVC